MLKLKRKCAVFTIVRNESIFLPIWINYYRSQFELQDIYILDHETFDGSINNVPEWINIRIVKNEITQDAHWMINTTQQFQKELFEKYEYVLFTNVDEIICPDPAKYQNITDFIIKNGHTDIFRCNAFEVLHFNDEEPPISGHKPILQQRKYWYSNNEMYGKPLLSRVPFEWIPGWHRVKNVRIDVIEDLRLIHLHRMDYNITKKKHDNVQKEKIYMPDLEKKWGWHLFLIQDDEFEKWFYSIEAATILHAPDSYDVFCKSKLRNIDQIKQEAKGLCVNIEPKWANVV